MQEFSSISVSQYEAGSLADQLTEQSRSGWSVVSIVSTGSTVTAYLSRAASADESAAHPTPEQPDEAAAEPTAEPTAEPAAEPDEVASISELAAAIVPDDETTTVDSAAEETGDANGWGSSSSEITPTAAEPSLPASASPEPAAAAAAATSTSAASTGGAPAGWYADPSSRFELRYWDGGQWTEHVSRSGQQYTDPPVT